MRMLDTVHQYVPSILKGFIASKCEENDPGAAKKVEKKRKVDEDTPKSYRTAEQVRAAWKYYYKIEHNCQDGGWRVDESGRCFGNPVDEIQLSKYVQTLRKQYRREYEIKQSLAMTLQDLTKMMEYLGRPEVRMKNDELNQLRALDKAGRPRIMTPCSADTIQRRLDAFTQEAGLIKDITRGRYTTHCFRRGGAQHCFMYANPRWSLKAAKWWGSWSDSTEHMDIERCLIDEIMACEASYDDQHSEDRFDRKHRVFMGEDVADEPATAGSVQSLQSEVTNLKTESTSIKTEMSNLISILTQNTLVLQQLQLQELPSTANPANTPQVALPSQGILQQQEENPSDRFCEKQYELISEQQQAASIPPLNDSFRPMIPPVETVNDILTQWFQGMPELGLHIPLKEWKPSMRRGNISSLYSQRKLVVEEWKYLGGLLEKMRHVHGKAIDSLFYLLRSIRKKSTERKATDVLLRSKRAADDVFEEEDGM
ncbi:hypothetical protein EC991_001594 [Linnemannia zychae]|nr:hypothetical protein EC991_001594 [Linnemannia zychae]